MNKITRNVVDGKSTYKLTTDNGQEMDCSLWFEKKTDAMHVKLPKDNPSGRTYIRQKIVDSSPNGIYEFETKTEFRSGLVGGGWKSKMTPEESKRMTELENEIETIKKNCQSRVVEKVDPNSVEGIQLQIDKLLLKMSKVKEKPEINERKVENILKDKIDKKNKAPGKVVILNPGK